MAEMILIALVLVILIALAVLYTLLAMSLIKLNESIKAQDEIIKKLQDHIKTLYKFTTNNENAILEIREELEDFSNPDLNAEFQKDLESWLSQA